MNSEMPPAGLAPITGRVTIKDVARVAGVSVATVSKVTNGRDGVAQATVDRVHEVVAELGYETSIVASSMRRKETRVIGILLAGFDPFATELLKGISARAIARGYELLAYSGAIADDNTVGWEKRSLSRLGGTLIDGAVMITPTVSIPDPPVPVVAIDPHAGFNEKLAVMTDNREGARIATQYLIGLGHRRIAHISGRSDLESAHEREQGYREALTEAGIKVDPKLIRYGGYRASWTVAPVKELLTMPNRPTAIFAANDLSAFGVMQAAEELGLSIPDDLSLIGFDDIPESADTSPRLTTMKQPLQEMGAAAYDMVTSQLRGEPLPEAFATFPAKLVVRNSAGQVPLEIHSPKSAGWSASSPI